MSIKLMSMSCTTRSESVIMSICYSLIKPLLTTILPENELSDVPC